MDKKKSHKESKLAVLRDMSKEMKSMMSPKEKKRAQEEMQGMTGDSMEKVTVSAANDEGLLEGLSTAMDLLKKKKS